MNLLDVMYAVGAVALSPIWARKARGGWKQRLGYTPALAAARAGVPRILLHAVSVGEVSAVRGLAAELAAGGAEVILATTTDTGLARAKALFEVPGSPVAAVVRYPLDFSRSVGRFLDAVKPDVVVLVELEVWPNFVAACTRRKIAIGVVNGRLSERSFKGYRKIRGVIGRSFAALDFALVQDEPYAERFRYMGVAAERCRVTGTMKWDTVDPSRAGVVGPEAEAIATSLGLDRERPVVVAGSTAEGEEALVHGALEEAVRREPSLAGVQLICAPRKPERFDAAAAALPGCVRRSMRKQAAAVAAGGTGSGTASATGRYLLDTLGELGACYQLADMVVIGRTFAPLGGSDPMEPAGLGKPLVCGRHMHNFSTVADALEAGGGLRRLGHSELASCFGELLASAQTRAAMSRANLLCVAEHRGATRRNAELILSVASGRAVAG